jgi:hypothetical protein
MLQTGKEAQINLRKFSNLELTNFIKDENDLLADSYSKCKNYFRQEPNVHLVNDVPERTSYEVRSGTNKLRYFSVPNIVN